jgi:hypothetical protein
MAALEELEGMLGQASNWIKRMQTSGADDVRQVDLKRCKRNLRSLKKRKKKAEESVQRAMLTDESLTEDQRQALGNKVAEDGVEMLTDGIAILDNALEEADATEAALAEQGEVLMQQRGKVKDTTGALKMANRYVKLMQNRDMKVRCYITGMWILMILTVSGVALGLYSKDEDANGGSGS